MEITKPSLLIDKDKCLRNISQMAQKVSSEKTRLRPHFKTHHSAEIGNWYRDFGVDSCTVSSVEMAAYFSKHGWNDITIAFPYNQRESAEISEIAGSCTLNILLESVESLKSANQLIEHPTGYFVKIDVGTHRTGIDPSNHSLIRELVNGSTEKVTFKGFLAHAGHTYSSSPDEIEQIYHKSVKILAGLQSEFGGIISYGDTPSCSMMKSFSELDEIRPGNFLFYDWMQKTIGSCELENIGVCMACPVVAIHEERNEVVIFGGAVHLSKDYVTEGRVSSFGKAVPMDGSKWQNEIIGNVRKLSQEHGIIKMSSENLSRIKVGQLIGVIPVHSCLAADLQGHYYSTSGEKIEKIVKQ